MRITITATVWTCLALAVSVEASPFVVQCSAEKPWGDQTIKVQIDIALPDKTDRFVFVSDRDRENVDIPDITRVGVGSIEITEILGDAKRSHRHKFIVTRMPGESNSLVGFYLTNSYTSSIRAELWKELKTFIYFDTYNNEVLQGVCR